MASNNQRGQILIEVCVVILLITLVSFAALRQLAELKNRQRKFQFTEDQSYVEKNYPRFKK